MKEFLRWERTIIEGSKENKSKGRKDRKKGTNTERKKAQYVQYCSWY